MHGRRRAGKRLPLVALAIGVVVALAIAACGGSSPEQSEPASTDQAKSGKSAPAGGSKQEASPGAKALTKLRASILHYGREGTQADIAAAGQTLSAFFLDRKYKYWGAACSYLEAEMKKRTQQIGGRGDAGCGRGVEALTATATTAEGETTIVKVKGLRRQDKQGFLIYETEAGKVNAMLMILEGGKWKLGGVNPTPLFSS